MDGQQEHAQGSGDDLATWMTGRPRRGSTFHDQVLVAHPLMSHGKFEHPEEDEPSTPGPTAVESKRELIWR